MKIPPGLGRLLRSPGSLAAYVTASLLLFELLHRVVETPQILSSAVLAVVFIPLLVLGMVATVFRILADPDGYGGTIAYVFLLLLVTIGFFAVLYTELGIVRAADGREVVAFWECLYFSVETFTTVGFGDFYPTVEARPVAAVEALSGYLLLGLAVAAAFALLTHHGTRRRERD